MWAVTISDKQLQWQEHPDPVPGHGEVLLNVQAAGLNAGDLLQLAGHYPAPLGSPADIPGLEVAGVVIEVGAGVEHVTVGDRVMAVVGGGGQGEKLVVHERCVIHIPDSMNWEEAGAFPEAFTTAHDALFTQAELALGERVCIHGGAGGVGTAAIQLALAAGSEVVATVRDPARREQVAGLTQQIGCPATALQVIDPEDFPNSGTYDVILELIGGPNLRNDISSLRKGGRISIIGVGGGPKAEISLLDLMTARGRIHGSTLRARPLEEKAVAARAVERHVMPWIRTRRMHVPIAGVFPMSKAADAYDAFRAGGKFGKIVLVREHSAD